jgi:hypothetical protein
VVNRPLKPGARYRLRLAADFRFVATVFVAAAVFLAGIFFLGDDFFLEALPIVAFVPCFFGAVGEVTAEAL